jgi:hypothetical protein
MDPFDYHDESLQPTKDRGAVLWNILAVVALLSACCVFIGFAAIFFNPQAGYNPFPPPTLPATITFPTSTPTPRSVLPPTWTPVPTLEPTNTATKTSTLEPTEPPATLVTGLPGTQAPPTPGEGMPFVLHEGDPVAIPNIAHPDLGCNWMGVAGKAYDLSGAPIVQGLFVQVGGTLNGIPIDEQLGMTGMVNDYGPGGYEFTLGDKPLASIQTLWVQLFDQAMIPLSDQIYFDTYADCDKNLILINFSQVR